MRFGLRCLGLLVLAMSLIGCSRGPSEQVTAVGSTALLPLVQLAAEVYQDEIDPWVTINVSGGGSFTGLEQVANGGADIGNSDVEATEAYIHAGLKDHRVAVAPFVIVVHPDVGVDSLTTEQIRSIFAGELTNWKDVGGKDLKVTIIHRSTSSGSRATIQQKLMGDKTFTIRAIVSDSSGRLRESVASTPGAIGYLDAAYVNEGIKAIAIDGVPYSEDALRSGDYRLYTFGHMYTRGEPRGLVKDFLDFILGPTFQDQYLKESGFLPVEAAPE